MFKVAPLSSGFFLVSILGFIVSSLMVIRASESWGLTLCIFFAIMFVASFISMTKADVMEELAMDEHPKIIFPSKKR